MGTGVGVAVGTGVGVDRGVGVAIGAGDFVGSAVGVGCGTEVGVGLVLPQAKPTTTNRVINPITVTCLTAISSWILAVRRVSPSISYWRSYY